ncbi:hypothetical protein M595_1311 [Lyngbya aestuarii BL J]|uniref:Uncharacterized protein n=1 Tax=Lyngbya aestuarii BL J TaxID=1348334 RepID=U7QNR0_9CYAN|nr:hypothetical protein M595_1311 [Lyngbya aestuarii BL J]
MKLDPDTITYEELRVEIIYNPYEGLKRNTFYRSVDNVFG